MPPIRIDRASTSRSSNSGPDPPHACDGLETVAPNRRQPTRSAEVAMPFDHKRRDVYQSTKLTSFRWAPRSSPCPDTSTDP